MKDKKETIQKSYNLHVTLLHDTNELVQIVKRNPTNPHRRELLKTLEDRCKILEKLVLSLRQELDSIE